jgi:hypothetical protein
MSMTYRGVWRSRRRSAKPKSRLPILVLPALRRFRAAIFGSLPASRAALVRSAPKPIYCGSADDNPTHHSGPIVIATA